MNKKTNELSSYTEMNRKYKYLFTNILSKPFDGFYEMRRNNAGNIWFIIVMFFLYGIIQILKFTSTGYIFNSNDQRDFNVFSVLTIAYIPFILFSIANYSVTTLMNGKGFLIDIIKVLGYSLVPLIMCQTISLVLSQFLSLEEQPFYLIIKGVGYLLFALYVFIGLVTIHEYGFLKGLLSLFITAVGIIIIIFVSILLMSLFQQLIGFITSLLREIRLR